MSKSLYRRLFGAFLLLLLAAAVATLWRFYRDLPDGAPGSMWLFPNMAAEVLLIVSVATLILAAFSMAAFAWQARCLSLAHSLASVVYIIIIVNCWGAASHVSGPATRMFVVALLCLSLSSFLNLANAAAHSAPT